MIDDYAEGKDSGIIDILLVGNIDHYHLNDLTRKTESYVNRKIRTLVISISDRDQLKGLLKDRPHILIWKADPAEVKTD